jgi:hypothetical protein
VNRRNGQRDRLSIWDYQYRQTAIEPTLKLIQVSSNLWPGPAKNPQAWVEKISPRLWENVCLFIGTMELMGGPDKNPAILEAYHSEFYHR